MKIDIKIVIETTTDNRPPIDDVSWVGQKAFDGPSVQWLKHSPFVFVYWCLSLSSSRMKFDVSAIYYCLPFFFFFTFSSSRNKCASKCVIYCNASVEKKSLSTTKLHSLQCVLFNNSLNAMPSLSISLSLSLCLSVCQLVALSFIH